MLELIIAFTLSLSTNQRVDYTRLRNLLQNQQWEEANHLTSALILKLANQEQQGYLVSKDTENLACRDIRTINQLWTQYSNGRFGLSVQARLWKSIGGQTSYDASTLMEGYQLSRRFESLVGWNNSQSSSAIQSEAVPNGYWPFRPTKDGGIQNAWGGGWISSISKRLESCKIK
ncbi:GUN4 domain-containing protein [Anabaena minutissima FACHB-250]|nr:GUN4 domain-containing protein [Anabaena minutissima FACHB-250]